jgi:hypothetical protein
MDCRVHHQAKGCLVGQGVHPIRAAKFAARSPKAALGFGLVWENRHDLIGFFRDMNFDAAKRVEWISKHLVYPSLCGGLLSQFWECFFDPIAGVVALAIGSI